MGAMGTDISFSKTNSTCPHIVTLLHFLMGTFRDLFYIRAMLGRALTHIIYGKVLTKKIWTIVEREITQHAANVAVKRS
jgi:hypothetical protein